MDQAGLKYVFTDFRQKPLENTPKSMEVFGQLLGQEDKAAEFNKFYTGKVDDIKSRAEKAGNKPRTLVWRAAGLKDCCSTVKDSNLGDLVNAAGGDDVLWLLSKHLFCGKVSRLGVQQAIAQVLTAGAVFRAGR